MSFSLLLIMTGMNDWDEWLGWMTGMNDWDDKPILA